MTPITITLTDDQVYLAINALHTAAEAYEHDAHECRAEPRLNAQFIKQATTAREIAAIIANS